MQWLRRDAQSRLCDSKDGWHSQWESNPCYRNENPMSWTARRWERNFIYAQLRYLMFIKKSILFRTFCMQAKNQKFFHKKHLQKSFLYI